MPDSSAPQGVSPLALTLGGGGQGRATLDIVLKAKLAVTAEACGVGMLWTDDHPGVDAFVGSAHLLNVTDTTKVGAGIARAFFRSPVATVSAARDLSELSNGRFVLGLATGTRNQNRHQLGLDEPRLISRMRDFVTAYRTLWQALDTGRACSHVGEYYQVQIPAVDAEHHVDEPPMFFGAVNSRMIEFAAQHGDGVYGHNSWTPHYIAEVVRPAIERGRAQTDRTGPFTISSSVYVVVDEDVDRARDIVARQIAYHMVPRSYTPIFEFNGWQREQALIHEAFHEHRDWDAAAAAVSDRMIDALAVFGHDGDVAAALRRRLSVSEQVTLYVPRMGWALDERRRAILAVLRMVDDHRLAASA